MFKFPLQLPRQHCLRLALITQFSVFMRRHEFTVRHVGARGANLHMPILTCASVFGVELCNVGG